MTGELLAERTARSKVASVDLTFSAPKSISVLFAVGDGELARSLLEAHEEAVGAAIGYLEDVACEVRRGGNGVRKERGEGFVTAAYRHRFSRAKDPQLHTHCVTANMAKGPDGRWTALHAKSIFEHAKAAGCLYQAHLRYAVRERLGWARWRLVVNGMAELEQIPDGVLLEFSQRRIQINERTQELEATGVSIDHAGRERIAYDTRDRKQEGVDAPAVRESIRARAGEHGLGANELDKLLASAPAVDPAPLEQIIAAVNAELAGPQGLTARRNTFGERDAVIAFSQAAAQGAPAQIVRDAADAFMSGREIVDVNPGAGEFSTRELLSQEQAIVNGAEERRGEGAGVLDERQVDAAVHALPVALGEEQLAVVRGVAVSGHGLESIEALAGTGKTTTAGALREAYERAGYTVLGAAPTGRAVRELKEQAGIEKALTLDGWGLRLQAHDAPLGLSRSVLILDEAGMAGTRITAPILHAAAEAGVKVIAFGDSGQLSSVPAGGWLGSLTRRLGSYELREVMRQRDPRERRLLAHVHRGHPAGYIDHKFAAGELHLSDGIAAEACAIEAWLQAVHEHGIDQAVLIARNNDRRGRLNARARDALEQAGLFGETVRVAEREFRVGERVIARLNAPALDVDNGTRGTIIDASEHRGLVMLTDAGQRRELPPSYVASHVEPAFCLTGHGMQGATVDWAAVVGQPGEFTRNWSYSACSRAREPTQLFIIDDQSAAELDREQIAPSPGWGEQEPPLARLAARMRVRDDEDLALDRLHDIAEPTTTTEQPAKASVDRQHAAKDPDERRARGRALRDRLAELDTQARDRSPVDRERWQRVRDELERRRAQLHAAEHASDASPPKGRWRKHRGAAEERERSRRLADSLADDVRVLETQECALAHHIPDPEQARVELHERVQAMRELAELRDRQIEHAIENPPAYLLGTLGERPESSLERHGWDRAASAIESYRFDHDITDPDRPLGGEPSAGRDRYDYEHALETITDARLALPLAPLDPVTDLGHDGQDFSPDEDRGL